MPELRKYSMQSRRGSFGGRTGFVLSVEIDHLVICVLVVRYHVLVLEIESFIIVSFQASDTILRRFRLRRLLVVTA